MTTFSLTEPSPIQGIRLLDLGAPGSGKTTKLRTTFELRRLLSLPFDMKLRVLALDPNVWSILGDTETAISPIKITGSWDNIMDLALKMKTLDTEQILKTDFRKRDQEIFTRLVARCQNFVDTKKYDHGCIDSWGTDTVLAIDGLSGLSDALSYGSLGFKPAWSQPDYQKVMNTISIFIKHILRSCYCHVVVLSHIEYETDALGVPRVMASTIGKKLAPTLGREFSDVVYSKNIGGKFTMSTSDAKVDLKAMHLPFEDGLPSSLVPLFTTKGKGWLERGGIISPIVPPEFNEPDYYKV